MYQELLEALRFASKAPRSSYVKPTVPMSNVLRIAIVDPNDTTREVIKSTLVGLDTVWLEAECSQYAFFQDVTKQTNPDIALINLDSDPDAGIRLIEELGQASPELSLLVSSSSTDGGLILRTMRAGAKEFLTQPLKPEELSAAIDRVARHRFGTKRRKWARWLSSDYPGRRYRGSWNHQLGGKPWLHSRGQP